MKDAEVIDLNALQKSCADCSLLELCLPRGLGVKALQQLDKVIKRSHTLNQGEYLFYAGDELQYIYALRSGSIKLHTLDGDGKIQILGFYFPGEILGFDAIHRNQHQCNASALETSSYCAFPYASLIDVCRAVPELQRQIFRLMSRELSPENALMLTLAKAGAAERLATFLLTLSARFRQRGYSALDLKLSMSRQEIANYLGLTIETISRLLGRMQRAGSVEVKRKYIRITNLAELKKLADTSIPLGPNRHCH